MTRRIGFDVGGVLTKRPDIWRPLIGALERGGYEVWVLTDMPHATAVERLARHGYHIHGERVVSANYAAHEDRCKAVAATMKLDLFVDDHLPYAASMVSKCVSLLVMPDLERPYEAPEEWGDK